MQQYVKEKVVPKFMRYEKKLHHLSEFKDSDFKTLFHCGIRHKIFLEADREQTNTQKVCTVYYNYVTTNTLILKHYLKGML